MTIEIDPFIPWVIWSEKHGAWWAGDELGYTNSFAAAGRYTRGAAQRILERVNRGPCVNCIAFPSPVLFFGRETVAGPATREDKPMERPPPRAIPADDDQEGG